MAGIESCQKSIKKKGAVLKPIRPLFLATFGCKKIISTDSNSI
jgi:hypothetical protein